MGIRFVPLADADTSAVRDLVMSFWGQHVRGRLADELFEWRYRARPSGDALLAFDGPRCIGIIDSLVRPYLLEGRAIDVRETCDWFCLPQYRPLGIGTALMRRFMARPEPILSIGGSEETRVLLQRLKWQRLTDVRDYVLPLTARAAAAWILRGLKLGRGAASSWIPAALPFRSLRRAPAGLPGARVEPMDERAEPADPLPVGHALAELLAEHDRRWLATAPRRMGQPIALQFMIDGARVGISLCRVEPYLVGTAGKILHLQVGDVAPAIVDWIVGETAQRLIDRGAEILFCRASCPVMVQALRRAGFLSLQARVAYWWSADRVPLSGVTSLGYLRADDAVPFDQLMPAHTVSMQPAAPDPCAAGENKTRWEADS